MRRVAIAVEEVGVTTNITVALEDDLDGPADETIRFGIGRTQYEIDMNNKNAAAFRKKLAPSSTRSGGLAGDSAAGRHVLQRAASVAPPSGPGRKNKVSRSAPADVPPQA